MINRVLDLQNLSVGQVMLPLNRVVGVDQETPMEEVLHLSRDRHFTRFPVWETVDGRRRIAGVLSLKTLLYEAGLDHARRAGDYAKPALFVGEAIRLEEALQMIQRSGQRLAVVLGRDGRETGIVTLQDILQRMFGEVEL
jgi:CBS domain containing-hemolysin-like protein